MRTTRFFSPAGDEEAAPGVCPWAGASAATVTIKARKQAVTRLTHKSKGKALPQTRLQPIPGADPHDERRAPAISLDPIKCYAGYFFSFSRVTLVC